MYGYFAVRALKFCSKVLLSNHFENISQARRQGDARGAHAPFAPPPPKKKIKAKKVRLMMVGLTISMHFQQFEDLKVQLFPGGPCSRIPLKTLAESSICSDLGGIVPILLENPESRFDFSRDTNILILKTASRGIYFC